ncbi:MAG: hypothetical protein ACD_76C00087G0001 [uncultured bacterium]|nr:MAG: hypothetical protein ACD_76C00087G0001 [uncultured bacterium]HBD05326.1 DNA mismatch repair protein MutT [Candidatus Uhrbacteria bacterium]
MKKTTLCYCLQNNLMLLGMKKRGFGSGKWNGYGGKVEQDEDIKNAAVREMREESGLVVKKEDLQQVALIRFYFDLNPVFECHVFVTRAWYGQLIETDEMSPQWFAVEDLPYADMWADDIKWIPLILDGLKIDADINFDAAGSVVKEFEYRLVEFD